MSGFSIGCNYWASNAGMYMWRRFDAEVVERDFKLLSSHGVKVLRIFPLWPDFQPVEKIFTSCKVLRERSGDKPIKTYAGLDEGQIKNFNTVLDLAEKYGFKIIVALITGWMSGRLFYPDILTNESPITSPKSIVWATRFISEFIPHFKDRECIIAWEPGNECNCMDAVLPGPRATAEQAELWLSSITNAIRAADNSRPVYAGMHGLEFDGIWNLDTVAHYVDMQTTHPYPLFTPYCATERITSMRAALHAAAESVYYSSTTDRPCLVEEAGTLGPTVISDSYSPEYFEKALFSSFQYGTTGFLWWCAFDQDIFDFSPYDMSGYERNLGLATSGGEAKPILKKLSEMSRVTAEIGDLPPHERDLTVLLTFGSVAWKNAYGSFCMAAEAGLSADFMYKTGAFKRSRHYIIPGLCTDINLPQLHELLREIENGASLLITYDGGHLAGFERITGLKIRGRELHRTEKAFSIGGKTVKISSAANLILSADTAEVLIENECGVILSRNKIGNGYVYFLNGAPESNYSETYNAHETNLCEIYRYVFSCAKKPISFKSNDLSVTYHGGDDGTVTVLLTNFGDKKSIEYELSGDYRIAGARYCEARDGALELRESYAVLNLKRA